MEKHERVGCLQILKLVVQVSRHLVEHGTLQVDHLVMGDHQDVFLAVGVGHGECHLVMVVFAEIGIQLHVLQEVVHPSHVPLQGESQAVVLRLAGNLRPCGGFLGDHHCSVIPSQIHCIQVLEELNRFKVLIVAVFIGNPTGRLSCRSPDTAWRRRRPRGDRPRGIPQSRKERWR